jgi:hypothetical protein
MNDSAAIFELLSQLLNTTTGSTAVSTKSFTLTTLILVVFMFLKAVETVVYYKRKRDKYLQKKIEEQVDEALSKERDSSPMPPNDRRSTRLKKRRV